MGGSGHCRHSGSRAARAAATLKADGHRVGRKTSMEGCTLAIKCLSPGVVHVTSFPITRHMKPSGHRKARKSNPLRCLGGESQRWPHSRALPSAPECLFSLFPLRPSKGCSCRLAPSSPHCTSVTTTQPRVSA